MVTVGIFCTEPLFVLMILLVLDMVTCKIDAVSRSESSLAGGGFRW